MKLFKVAVLTLMTAAAVGCTSTQIAPRPAEFTAKPGNGLVYFYREKSFVGMAVSYYVTEGETRLGAMKNGTFFTVDAAPGKHTYSAKTEVTREITLDVKEGETYYVKGGVTMGALAGRPSLTGVTEGEARDKISALTYTTLTPDN